MLLRVSELCGAPATRFCVGMQVIRRRASPLPPVKDLAAEGSSSFSLPSGLTFWSDNWYFAPNQYNGPVPFRDVLAETLALRVAKAMSVKQS